MPTKIATQIYFLKLLNFSVKDFIFYITHFLTIIPNI